MYSRSPMKSKHPTTPDGKTLLEDRIEAGNYKFNYVFIAKQIKQLTRLISFYSTSMWLFCGLSSDFIVSQLSVFAQQV